MTARGGEMNIRKAAEEVLRCVDAYRDAQNGLGHEGTPHDRDIHIDPCTNLSYVEHIYDITGDCAGCGGAQYGTEYQLQQAYGQLRRALGQEPMAWER